MLTISAIIIAKDSEHIITDCLESVSFCDEIILIDNGSKDKTINVAKKYHAKIYAYASRNFAELRNIGLKKAKSHYVLFLDTDERIDINLKDEIRQILLNCDDFSAYYLRRRNFYLGNHLWPSIEIMERLFLRLSLKKWVGALHETPIYKGKIKVIEKGYINHYTHRNLTEMLKKTIEWSEIEARNRIMLNHPPMVWWRFPRVILGQFINFYVLQKGYKLGIVGLIESIYQSFSIFITYAKLWEMQKNKE